MIELILIKELTKNMMKVMIMSGAGAGLTLCLRRVDDFLTR